MSDIDHKRHVPFSEQKTRKFYIQLTEKYYDLYFNFTSTIRLLLFFDSCNSKRALDASSKRSFWMRVLAVCIRGLVDEWVEKVAAGVTWMLLRLIKTRPRWLFNWFFIRSQLLVFVADDVSCVLLLKIASLGYIKAMRLITVPSWFNDAVRMEKNTAVVDFIRWQL